MVEDTTANVWLGIEPIAPGKPVLLEASAGTGKTWQIAHLVARLVALEGVPIQRILVITFTKKATAELRDRVRQRLVVVREMLQAPARPDDSQDPMLAMMWDAPAQVDDAVDGDTEDADGGEAALRRLRANRVQQALTEFDRAGLSTIHGFSQRSLEEFAFESGQEPNLEVVSDAQEIRAEYVADVLARAYAPASMEEARALDTLGCNPEQVENIVKAMTGAVAPTLRPEPASLETLPRDPLALAKIWCAKLQQARTDLAEDEDVARAREAFPKLKHGRGALKATATKALDHLAGWIASGATGSDCGGKSGTKYLHGEGIKTPEDDPTYEAVGPLFEMVEGLFEARATLATAMAVAIGEGARAHLESELIRRRQLTYDAMLSRLAERVEAQGSLGRLASALRERYHVALVDEFQDTDEAQWAVMRAVFVHPERRLVLIGDPKQSIYAFRSADIHVYLKAKAAAVGGAFTMNRNYRTDAPLIDAMNHLWAAGSGAFGMENLDYVKVHAQHQEPRVALPMHEAPQRPRAPLEIRWLDAQVLDPQAATVGLPKNQMLPAVAEACAEEVATLLRSGGEMMTAKGRALRPGDIAILVNKHREAAALEGPLRARNIPFVRTARESVFASDAATWLTQWMLAVASGGRGSSARVLFISPLFGRNVADLEAALSEPSAAQWTQWTATVAGWSRVWAKSGFVAAFEAMLDGHDVLPRILAHEDGDRHATDLRHLMELAHAHQSTTFASPSTLAVWMQEQRQAAQASEDEAKVRLERDDDAVKIETVHASKGLEYPVVLAPFAWNARDDKDPGRPCPVHLDGTLYLDVHASGHPARALAWTTHAEEQRQEDTRKLYVALTRAAHHLVVWMAALDKHAPTSSALGRLLLRPRDAQGAVSGDVAALPEFKSGARDDYTQPLKHLADTSHGTIAWSVVSLPEGAGTRWEGDSTDRALEVRPWSGRSLTGAFQVTSYSSLVKGRSTDLDEPLRLEAREDTGAPSHDEVPIAAASDGTSISSEAPAHESPAAAATVLLAEPSVDASLDAAPSSVMPLQQMWGGTKVGTWVHAVFEHLDFQSGQALDGRTTGALIAELGARHGVRAAREHARLEAALPVILDTPLATGDATDDPLVGWSLRRLTMQHRLDELGFDLRLGAGTAYTRGSGSGSAAAADVPCDPAQRRVDEVAVRAAMQAAVDAASGPMDAPRRAYLEQLLARVGKDGTPAPVLPRLAGVLTGFIDLTFRVPRPGRTGDAPEDFCYFISDYKTNRIVSRVPGASTSPRNYTRPWMAWEMSHHGYHLQALLYQLALHRLLRVRLRDAYDPAVHLGGHVYLFVRGMMGPESALSDGTVRGVFRDRFQVSLIEALDAALDGGANVGNAGGQTR